MDLAQRRQQLRLKQVDAVKKFRQSNTSVSAATQKRKEREEMKKKLEKKLKMKLRMNQLILKTLMEICMLK